MRSQQRDVWESHIWMSRHYDFCSKDADMLWASIRLLSQVLQIDVRCTPLSSLKDHMMPSTDRVLLIYMLRVYPQFMWPPFFHVFCTIKRRRNMVSKIDSKHGSNYSCRFIKAKTTLENCDLEAVTRLGIKLLLETPDNLFIQVCESFQNWFCFFHLFCFTDPRHFGLSVLLEIFHLITMVPFHLMPSNADF